MTETLPAGWVKKFNEKNQRDYYFNTDTKITQWNPPDGTVTSIASALSDNVGLPAGWVKKHDAKKGKDYYYHAETKKTQWDAPEGTAVASATTSVAAVAPVAAASGVSLGEVVSIPLSAPDWKSVVWLRDGAWMDLALLSMTGYGAKCEIAIQRPKVLATEIPTAPPPVGPKSVDDKKKLPLAEPLVISCSKLISVTFRQVSRIASFDSI